MFDWLTLRLYMQSLISQVSQKWCHTSSSSWSEKLVLRSCRSLQHQTTLNITSATYNSVLTSRISHPTPHHTIPLYHIPSHHIQSHHITPQPIPSILHRRYNTHVSHPIPMYAIPFHLILSHPTVSYPILSYILGIIRMYPILSHPNVYILPILFYNILSYHYLSAHIFSRPQYLQLEYLSATYVTFCRSDGQHIYTLASVKGWKDTRCLWLSGVVKPGLEKIMIF